MGRLKKFLCDYGFTYHLDEWIDNSTVTEIRHDKKPHIVVRLTPELWQDLNAYSRTIDVEDEVISLIRDSFTRYGQTDIKELLGLSPLKRLNKFKLQ